MRGPPYNPPSVEVQAIERIVEVPGQIQTSAKIVEVPQSQTGEKIVEVPIQQIQAPAVSFEIYSETEEEEEEDDKGKSVGREVELAAVASGGNGGRGKGKGHGSMEVHGCVEVRWAGDGREEEGGGWEGE